MTVPLVVVDLQGAAADDADLAHLPADQGGVAGGAAEGGEDAVGRLHAADVLRAGFAADQDDAAFGRACRERRACRACATHASASSAKNLIRPVAAPGPALMPLASSLPSAMALRLASGSKIGCRSWFRSSGGIGRPTGLLPW